MTKTANLQTIEKVTKRTWEEWLEFFNSIDAKNLSHAEIAKKVHAEIHDGWWAQGITVAYEQHIGRRKPGQRANGKYEVAVSRTIRGSMDDVFEKWCRAVAEKREFNGTDIENTPTTNATEKWRYWHCKLADAGRVTVAVYQKTPDKAGFAIAQSGLPSADSVEQWRPFWKDFIEKV